MNDRSNRVAVIVGLFVLFGLLILVGGILTIGDLRDTFTRKMAVTAVFDEVGGLKTGDNVWFSGVKVGVVKELQLQDASRVEVGLTIDRDAARFIPDDALARVGSDGLIGNKIVVLYAGTPDGPRITDGKVLGVEDRISTEEMIAMLQENNANLHAITGDLKVLTAQLAAGEGSAGRLLMEDGLYEDLSASAASLRQTAERTPQLVSQMNRFTSKLNQEGTLPNDLVTDRETWAKLTASVQDLQKVAEHAGALADKLDQGVNDPGTPLGTMVGDQAAGDDLQTVLANLVESSRLLSEDLEAAQHNLLLRGFFRKKEKAAEKAAKEAEKAEKAGR